MAAESTPTGFLSWFPVQAAYDTMRRAGVPDEAYSAKVLAICRRMQTTREFVSWDDYMTLWEEARAYLGSDEKLIEASVDFDAAVPQLRAFADQMADVDAFFRFVIEVYDGAAFPEVSFSTRKLADDVIEIDVSIPPSYPDSRVWFVASIGTVQSMPRHLGMPLCKVEAEVGSHRGRYLVTFPSLERSPAAAREAPPNGASELFAILRDDIRRAMPANAKKPTPEKQLRNLAERWGLTPRETDVAGLLCRGLSNKEIAAELACAVRTVELHVTRVFDKAGVDSRAQLILHFTSPED